MGPNILSWKMNSTNVCPSGFVLDSEAIVAGSFCGTLNGQPLSSGVHILVFHQVNSTAFQVRFHLIYLSNYLFLSTLSIDIY
jgi:hypothetical protein